MIITDLRHVSVMMWDAPDARREMLLIAGRTLQPYDTINLF